MTEQETREKIAEIMERVWYEPVPCTIERKHEAIVDALVEGGLRFGESYSHTATFNIAQLDRINELERRLAEEEHRAEVAEMALKKLAYTCLDIQGYQKEEIPILAVEFVVPDYIKLAEEELAEDGKDEH